MKRRSFILFVSCFAMVLLLCLTLMDTPVDRIAHSHNCRFWGIVYAEKDQLVRNTINNHLDSLRALGTFHDDGWGVAYYVETDNGLPLPVVERGEPEALLDPRFSRAQDHVIDQAHQGAIAHIRNASSGPQSGIPDPHPFSRYSAYRTFHMFFAHNGTMDTDILLSLIKKTNPLYLDLNPPDYAPEYLDSDLYALFLLEIIDMNSGKSIEECIRIAITAIDSAFSVGSAQCNFVMFDGTNLYAVNFARSPADALTLYLYAPLGRSQFWAVASEPLDDQQQCWIAVPNSTLVVLKPNTTPRFYDVLIDRDRTLENHGFNIIYPNPGTAPVTISFTLPEQYAVNRTFYLRIFNSAGQHVRTLHTNPTNRSNPNSVIWHGLDDQGRHVPNGAYYCCLSLGDSVYTKKVIYVR